MMQGRERHLCCIVDAVQPGATGLVEVVVRRGRQHGELFCKAWVSLGGRCQLVEYVVVPLGLGLVSDPRLFQQVVLGKCFSPQRPAANIVTFDISPLLPITTLSLSIIDLASFSQDIMVT